MLSSLQNLYTFQVWKHPQSLFQNRSSCYSQGVGHLPPFHLRDHSFKIQVSALIHIIGNLILRKMWKFWRDYFSNRDTLAEKVPCLHCLSQAPRRDCISVSQSESFSKDSVLSRQSSVSKTKFQRVSSMSMSDTVSLASVLCSEEDLCLCSVSLESG